MFDDQQMERLHEQARAAGTALGEEIREHFNREARGRVKAAVQVECEDLIRYVKVRLSKAGFTDEEVQSIVVCIGEEYD